MSVENVKVGDKVRCLITECDVVTGKIYSVIQVDKDDNTLRVRDDVGDDWWLSNGEWQLITPLSANDTVRLKSGESFTTGSYTAEVDSVADDKVILKHGSWLPLDAVEKVEHRFKVGDRVRVVDPFTFRTGTKVGDVGIVTSVEYGGRTDGQDRVYIDLSHSRDGIIEQVCAASRIELVEPASASAPSQPSPREPLVVTLSLDASSFSRDLADQFQRIAEALRAA